jgi:ectoine hydroxylase-related dioxygenase (phytanoyl-CoA dioxygenase family)
VKQHQLFFRQMGYLIDRRVFSQEACRALSEEVRSNCATSIIGPQESARIEGVTENYNLREWLGSQTFADCATRLLGPNWNVILNRHNHITIDYGGGLASGRSHRDSLQWTRSFLTAIIGLDMPESSQSWPVIVPGSHLWPVAARPNGGGYWLDEDDQRDMSDQEVLVRLGPGDVLFLDPMTFHRAGVGFKTQPRIVWTIALRASDELSLYQPANELIVQGEHVYAGQDRWERRDA